MSTGRFCPVWLSPSLLALMPTLSVWIGAGIIGLVRVGLQGVHIVVDTSLEGTANVTTDHRRLQAHKCPRDVDSFLSLFGGLFFMFRLSCRQVVP